MAFYMSLETLHDTQLPSLACTGIWSCVLLTTETENVETLVRIEHHKVRTKDHSCGLLDVVVHLSAEGKTGWPQYIPPLSFTYSNLKIYTKQINPKLIEPQKQAYMHKCFTHGFQAAVMCCQSSSCMQANTHCLLTNYMYHMPRTWLATPAADVIDKTKLLSSTKAQELTVCVFIVTFIRNKHQFWWYFDLLTGVWRQKKHL